MKDVLEPMYYVRLNQDQPNEALVRIDRIESIVKNVSGHINGNTMVRTFTGKEHVAMESVEEIVKKMTVAYKHMGSEGLCVTNFGN